VDRTTDPNVSLIAQFGMGAPALFSIFTPRFVKYAAAIWQAVTTASCLRDETRPTHYPAVMRLWLSVAGTVTRVEILSTTGSPSLDVAIGDAAGAGLDLEKCRPGKKVCGFFARSPDYKYARRDRWERLE
jgi:hypothetical protein